MAETAPRPDRHEAPGVPPRVALAGIGAGVLLLLAGLGTAALVMPSRPAETQRVLVRQTPPGPPPRLQLAPALDLAAYRARQGRLLHTEAAIPIEQAMAEIATRPDPTAALTGDER